MAKVKTSKELILRLSTEEYRDLKWLSQKLGLSVSNTLRGLIPKYQRPPGKIIELKDISRAQPEDSVKLLDSFDRDRLRTLLRKLRSRGSAVTLCSELELELLERGADCLSFPVYARLSRWISPRRHTARENKVQPIAADISKLIFGEVIGRGF